MDIKSYYQKQKKYFDRGISSWYILGPSSFFIFPNHRTLKFPKMKCNQQIKKLWPYKTKNKASLNNELLHAVLILAQCSLFTNLNIQHVIILVINNGLVQPLPTPIT